MPIRGPFFDQRKHVVADLDPGARVVKAFNHLTSARLSGDPRSEGGKPVLFQSGNARRAEAEVAAIIDQIGFFGASPRLLTLRAEPGG